MTVAPMGDPLEPLRQWFAAWEVCVRSVDTRSARSLFDTNVVSFGTHAEIVSGLDALVAEQWNAIWPNIGDFRFLVDKLRGEIVEAHAWAAVPWTSTGYDQHGSGFVRPGRATVTFRRDGQCWLGTHTHFSLRPGTPPRTHGRTAAKS